MQLVMLYPLSSALCALAFVESPGEQVIIITDAGEDLDDEMTLVMARFLIDQRKIELRAVIANLYPAMARARLVRGTLDHLGLQSVPVGVGTDGGSLTHQDTFSQTASTYIAPVDSQRAISIEPGRALLHRVLMASSDNSQTLLCISSLKDAAVFLRDNAPLCQAKLKCVVVMGGVDAASSEQAKVLRPDSAHNNMFDDAAASYFYLACQRYGIPLKVVSRHAAYGAPIPRSIYDRLAQTGSPIGWRLRKRQRDAIERLWRRACAPPGSPEREGLPERCNKEWFSATFCDGKADERKPGDLIWDLVVSFNMYDVVALLACSPPLAAQLFSPRTLTVDGVTHQVIGWAKDEDNVKNSKDLAVLIQRGVLRGMTTVANLHTRPRVVLVLTDSLTEPAALPTLLMLRALVEFNVITCMAVLLFEDRRDKAAHARHAATRDGILKSLGLEGATSLLLFEQATEGSEAEMDALLRLYARVPNGGVRLVVTHCPRLVARFSREHALLFREKTEAVITLGECARLGEDEGDDDDEDDELVELLGGRGGGGGASAVSGTRGMGGGGRGSSAAGSPDHCAAEGGGSSRNARLFAPLPLEGRRSFRSSGSGRGGGPAAAGATASAGAKGKGVGRSYSSPEQSGRRANLVSAAASAAASAAEAGRRLGRWSVGSGTSNGGGGGGGGRADGARSGCAERSNRNSGVDGSPGPRRRSTAHAGSRGASGGSEGQASDVHLHVEAASMLTGSVAAAALLRDQCLQLGIPLVLMPPTLVTACSLPAEIFDAVESVGGTLGARVATAVRASFNGLWGAVQQQARVATVVSGGDCDSDDDNDDDGAARGAEAAVALGSAQAAGGVAQPRMELDLEAGLSADAPVSASPERGGGAARPRDLAAGARAASPSHSPFSPPAAANQGEEAAAGSSADAAGSARANARLSPPLPTSAAAPSAAERPAMLSVPPSGGHVSSVSPGRRSCLRVASSASSGAWSEVGGADASRARAGGTPAADGAPSAAREAKEGAPARTMRISLQLTPAQQGELDAARALSRRPRASSVVPQVPLPPACTVDWFEQTYCRLPRRGDLRSLADVWEAGGSAGRGAGGAGGSPAPQDDIWPDIKKLHASGCVALLAASGRTSSQLLAVGSTVVVRGAAHKSLALNSAHEQQQVRQLIAQLVIKAVAINSSEFWAGDRSSHGTSGAPASRRQTSLDDDDGAPADGSHGRGLSPAWAGAAKRWRRSVSTGCTRSSAVSSSSLGEPGSVGGAADRRASATSTVGGNGGAVAYTPSLVASHASAGAEEPTFTFEGLGTITLTDALPEWLAETQPSRPDKGGAGDGRPLRRGEGVSSSALSTLLQHMFDPPAPAAGGADGGHGSGGASRLSNASAGSAQHSSLHSRRASTPRFASKTRPWRHSANFPVASSQPKESSASPERGGSAALWGKGEQARQERQHSHSRSLPSLLARRAAPHDGPAPRARAAGVRVVPVGGSSPPTSFFREVAADDVRRLRSVRLSDEEQDEQQRVDEILRAATRYHAPDVLDASCRGARFSTVSTAPSGARGSRISVGLSNLVASVAGGFVSPNGAERGGAHADGSTGNRSVPRGAHADGSTGSRSVPQSPHRHNRPQSPARGSCSRVASWAAGAMPLQPACACGAAAAAAAGSAAQHNAPAMPSAAGSLSVSFMDSRDRVSTRTQ